MKRLVLLVLGLTLSMAFLGVIAQPAQAAPPCNDADGDGSPSGQEYAQNHIRPLATTGGLGADGHKPGSHHGFSVCNPSGN